MPYEYFCEILSVVDGDNLKLRLDQGLDDERRISLRMAGYDAAEKSDAPRGEQARTIVERSIATVASTPGFKKWIIKTEKTRKGDDIKSFDRYVGHLFALFDGGSKLFLNRALFEELKAADLLKRGSKWNLLENQPK